MPERVFAFQCITADKYDRPQLYAFRESEIKTIRSQRGSENCHLVVNEIHVKGSFDDLIEKLGERVEIK
jgi:hypothetical protein